MRAVIYCRISDDRTGERAGVTRQEEDCRALCQRQGWDVAAVYTDNDISAYRGKPRPGWKAVARLLRSGGAQVLVGWHPDRFTRHTRELEDLIDLVESAGAKVATVAAGDYDLSTPAGRMSARIVGAVARGESEHRSERVKRASDQAMAEGRQWGRGRRPYGYTLDRSEIVPDEAERIRDAAQRIIGGESARSIAMEWNAAGYPTVSGGQWSSGRILTMLRSAHLAGYRQHQDRIIAKASWPAILDELTYRRLQAALPSGRTVPRKRDYVLSLILVCGREGCGTPMVGSAKAGGVRTYRCHLDAGRKGCGGMVIIAEPCEEWIIEAVLHRLTGPAMVAQRRRARQSTAGPLIERVSALEAELETLTGDYAADRIERAQFLSLTAATRRKLDQARRELAAVDTSGVEIPDSEAELRKQWAIESFGWRRAVILEALESITVNPAVRGRNFFDPGRLDPRWRA